MDTLFNNDANYDGGYDNSYEYESHEQPSFGSHIDDLYDHKITSAEHSHISHLKDAAHSLSEDDFSYHLNEADKALDDANFWHQAKQDAIYDSEINRLHHESIIKPLETAEKYQHELEDIFSNHGKDVSFGSQPHNHYDDNTVDFLNKCKQHSINLPPNIDHSHLQSEYVVDRSYYGGLSSIDKSIIQNTLKNNFDSGNLSEDDYNDLIKSLSKC